MFYGIFGLNNVNLNLFEFGNLGESWCKNFEFWFKFENLQLGDLGDWIIRVSVGGFIIFDFYFGVGSW